MKTLLLMRHGDAPQARTDKERMLSELGRQQCRLMAMYLQDLELKKVISSDYQRAIDSATFVAENYLNQIAFDQCEILRPMSHPKTALNFISDEIEALDSGSTLLVVCHMPLIAEMASLAIDGNLQNHYGFPCASIMKLKTEFAAEGCFELLAQYNPDL